MQRRGDNQRNLVGSRAKADGKTYITAKSGETYELLNHVSLDELINIVTDIPFFNVKQHVTYAKREDKQFKINLGSGTFGKVTLARKKNSEGIYEYFAIKKVQTQEKIRKKNATRAEVLVYTKAEIDLQNELKESQLTQNISVIESHANVIKPKWSSENYEQIYQIMPLAEFGNCENFINTINGNKEINLAEKRNSLKYFANTLITTVSRMNKNKVFFRDLKLENLLVKSTGELLLSDLGSATIYGQHKLFETSPWSDTAYHPPLAFFAHATKQQEDELRDKWALALALLSLWGNETKALMHSFSTLAVKYAMENNKNLLRDKYLALIEELTLTLRETSMPPYIQKIILSIVDFSKEKQLSLEAIANEHRDELTMNIEEMTSVQNLFTKVQVTAADSNQKFLAMFVHDVEREPEETANDFKEDEDDYDEIAKPKPSKPNLETTPFSETEIIEALCYRINQSTFFEYGNENEIPAKVKLLKNYLNRPESREPGVLKELTKLIKVDSGIGILSHPYSQNEKENKLCLVICRLAENINDKEALAYIKDIQDDISYSSAMQSSPDVY